MSKTVPEQSFAGRLTPGGRPAVLAIDMMAAYFTDGSPFCLPSTACLDAAAAVLAEARRAGVPVLHTAVAYPPGSAESLVFVQKVPALRLLEEGGELGELMPQVSPEGGEPVLVKQHASAFFGTDLAGRLAELEVDTVVVVGVSTSGCVRATAVDAVAHNLVPLVVRDGVADRTPEVHDASLFDLQAKYAEVIDLQSALRYLARLSAAD